MIWYISGDIIDISENMVLINTNSWIWYELVINELIYSSLINKKETELFVHHHITENSQSLFWFLSLEDKTLFKELIKISGVWGRVGQAILSLWWERLKSAVLEEDKKLIESIKWVWKKMAEKIVLELKDKDFVKNHISTSSKTEWTKKESSFLDPSLKSQILETLTSMWYDNKSILEVLQNLPEDKKTIDDILPFVIRNM